MPTYQYACTACGHRFEAVQSFSDASLTECPECAGKLRKLFGSVGVVFKGSGFYRTDSRAEGNGKKAAAKSESSKAESTSKSSDGGSSSTTSSTAASSTSGSGGASSSSSSSSATAAAS